MNKKTGIAISLVLAIIFTLGVLYTSNQKYVQATKSVDVVRAEKYIPAGTLIGPADVSLVPVPENMVAGMSTDIDLVIGKASKVSLLKGQYVYESGIGTSYGRKPGHVEMYIPTDLSSSAMALAGEHVNIHFASKANEVMTAPVVYRSARVLRSLDANGNEIDPARGKELSQMAAGGTVIPVAIAVEIPAGSEDSLVQLASKKLLYLTKTEGE